MADYYSLLSKAVANLPKVGPASARQVIYSRARTALLRQLRSLGPSLSEADIAREEASLEFAIARLETQFAPPAPAPSASPPAAPAHPAPSARFAPLAPPPHFVPPPHAPAHPAPSAQSAAFASRPADAYLRPPSAPKFAPPPRPSASPAQPGAPTRPSPPPPPPVAPEPPPLRPAAPRPPTAPAAGAGQRPPMGVEAPVRPTLGARPAPAAPRFSPPPPPPPQHAPPPPPAPSAPPPPPHRASAISAPAIVAASEEDLDLESQAPTIDAAAGLDRVAYAPAPVESDSIRPIAPSRIEAPRVNPLPWILLAVIVGVVLSVAVAAFLLRQKPQDLAIKEPTEVTESPSATPAAKISERVGGAEATPAPAPTPAPASSAEATPAANPAAAPAPAASSPAAATSPQPAATPGLPVAARAAMLIAVASDQQKPPAVSLGSVVWSTIPAVPGQPETVAVKAEADIPDLKMHAVMTIRKNTDASLPASHTIDLRVTFGDGAEIKGIKDMRVPMMRRDDPPAQDPLSGVRVKISDNYFLVGLNRADTDATHNVDLIATRNWFDFPLLLNDDRIAKLTFEKGADGERIVNEALAAWKGPSGKGP